MGYLLSPLRSLGPVHSTGTSCRCSLNLTHSFPCLAWTCAYPSEVRRWTLEGPLYFYLLTLGLPLWILLPLKHSCDKSMCKGNESPQTTCRCIVNTRRTVLAPCCLVPFKPVQLYACIRRQQIKLSCLPTNRAFLSSLLFFSPHRKGNHLNLGLTWNCELLHGLLPLIKILTKVSFSTSVQLSVISGVFFSKSSLLWLSVSEENNVPVKAVHGKRWKSSGLLVLQQISFKNKTHVVFCLQTWEEKERQWESKEELPG